MVVRGSKRDRRRSEMKVMVRGREVDRVRGSKRNRWRGKKKVMVKGREEPNEGRRKGGR